MMITTTMANVGARWRQAILLSFLVAGCSARNDVEPSSSTVIDGLEVQCGHSNDGGYLVDVVSRSGGAPARFVFSAAPTGLKVSWGSHELIVDGATLPDSCAQPSRLAAWYYPELPRLERESAATSEKPLDSWGCDTTFGPDWVRTVMQFLYGTISPVDLNSCDGWGQCCDTHDVCYANNSCSASSWAHTLYCISLAGMGANPYACFDSCDNCNVNAGACFFGPAVGPSSCCSPSCNVCGIPRNAANPISGCVADCQCPNGLACDGSTGICGPPHQPGFCGDLICNQDFNTENCSSCPGDCPCPYNYECSAGACVPFGTVCGDGHCDASETCSSCPSDCQCAWNETCSNGACVSSGLCGGSGSSCSSSSDCCSGYNCTNGTCSDPNCPSGRYCDPDASYDCGDQLTSYCDYATLCCHDI